MKKIKKNLICKKIKKISESLKHQRKESENPLYYHLKTEKNLAFREEQLKEYKEAFYLFDREHKGLIGVDETYSSLKNFGNPTSKKRHINQ